MRLQSRKPHKAPIRRNGDNGAKERSFSSDHPTAYRPSIQSALLNNEVARKKPVKHDPYPRFRPFSMEFCQMDQIGTNILYRGTDIENKGSEHLA